MQGEAAGPRVWQSTQRPTRWSPLPPQEWAAPGYAISMQGTAPRHAMPPPSLCFPLASLLNIRRGTGKKGGVQDGFAHLNTLSAEKLSPS
eukprot:283965-Chlamydomonas_euryale.AAC.1